MTTAVTSPETGGKEGGGTDRTTSSRTCFYGSVNSPCTCDLPAWVQPPLTQRAPFRRLHPVFTMLLVKLATGNGSLHRQKGASCSYVSLCDKMKTGATASSRDPGGWCSIGTNLACGPTPGNRLHLRATLGRLCQSPLALLSTLAM